MLDKYKKVILLTDNTGYTAGFSGIHNPTAAGVTASVTGRFNEDNTTVNVRIASGDILGLSVKYIKPIGGNLVGLL